MHALRRFCLYGFLKNQQYYDPFIVLAFLQMGLNFTLIGLLVAFREIMINVMEVPSGALADLYGRRKCMIMSFLGYIVSFLVFGCSGLWAQRAAPGMGRLMPVLLAGMLFFAVGDAFRTGTHKAMIFAWLHGQGRTDEKTRVYGYTRSWSKIGSALSVLLAGLFVLLTDNFAYVFFFSAIPCVLSIINLLGYPPEVDGIAGTAARRGGLATHLHRSLSHCFREPALRRLLAESMGFEGFFKAIKDYLQPVLMAAAIPLAATWFGAATLTDVQSSVILVAPVFFILFMLSAAASRNAHRLVERPGAEDKAARNLWALFGVVLLAMLPAMVLGASGVMIAGFVLLHVVQNLWRPVLISRFDAHSSATDGATILSIENQAKSLSTMILAPLVGLAVDLCGRHGIGVTPFWPIAALGVVVAAGFVLTGRSNAPRSAA